MAERQRAHAVEKPMPKVTFERNEDRFEPLEAKYVRFLIRESMGNARPCLDELEVYGSEEPERNLAGQIIDPTIQVFFSGQTILSGQPGRNV